jgi:hypothetical protein
MTLIPRQDLRRLVPDQTPDDVDNVADTVSFVHRAAECRQLPCEPFGQVFLVDRWPDELSGVPQLRARQSRLTSCRPEHITHACAFVGRHGFVALRRLAQRS